MPTSEPDRASVSPRRRQLLQIGGAGLFMAAFPLAGAARALTDAEARQLIDRLLADLNAIINSGKSESAMYRDFEALFAKYGDVPIIARSALGVAWRRATPAQRTAFTKAFATYMARKYGRRFREFIGGKLVVTGARKVKSGYLVNTVAHLKGQEPFEVAFQVSDKSGRIKMFNMYIEGVSLLATERTEIGAMLDRRKGDIDKLIADLRKI